LVKLTVKLRIFRLCGTLHVVLNQCRTCNFVIVLSRDKIASVTWRVVQLCDSCATYFLNRAALCSVQLCRENAVNADWSILVNATKLQCATCTVTYCNFGVTVLCSFVLKCVKCFETVKVCFKRKYALVMHIFSWCCTNSGELYKVNTQLAKILWISLKV